MSPSLNILAVPETLAVILLLFAAAWRDIATRSIPDTVSAAIALLGLLARSRLGMPETIVSAAAAAVLFVLLAILHARFLLGGGDVKLMAAVACGLSLPHLYHFMLATALAGGALALVYLLLRRLPRDAAPKPRARSTSSILRVFSVERWRISRHHPLPYGVAIACGGIIASALA